MSNEPTPKREKKETVRIWMAATAALAVIAAPAGARPPVLTVTPADAPAIQQAIASHRGHVVVVNFWATWCGPCVEEFPDLVRLQHRYRSKGLVVMAVSADSTPDIKTKVIPFLRAEGADFPQFLEHAADPGKFIDAFDPAWQGDLPRTLIYDRRGKLVQELSGKQTPAQFTAAVAPLLREK
ncbi:MAG: TlpA family protein disulfide reductase [Capsulimonadaceae bacterium]